MAGMDKSEINLEISTGFFRISTSEVVYNITVLGGAESPAGQVVQQIVDQERQQPPEPPRFTAGDDGYYKQVSTDIYRDIGQLAKSLSSTIMELPAEDRRAKRAELDEAGEKIEDAKSQLRDIVSMTEKATMEIMDQVEKVQSQTDDVKDLLAQLKHHAAFQLGGEKAEPGEMTGLLVDPASLAELEERLTEARELAAALQGTSPVPAAGEQEAAGVTASRARRYLFPLDTVFQTIYELCTNEAVKGHIAAAREKAASLFDADAFVDAISVKAAELAPDDDGFFTMPLSDVLAALAAACKDKKVKNLLKNMDDKQTEIFLDQSLPLPAPSVEEPAAASESEAAKDEEPETAGGKGLEELTAILDASLALVKGLRDKGGEMVPVVSAGMSQMTLEDQQEIFNKIESAFQVATGICDDVTRITEALSFQDLSGQQILKIIKLLSDFQVQLLALVVSFGTQLKIKERNAAISPAESKRLAQEDVDRYLKTVTGVAEEGPLDQEAVNRMLEELGF